MSKYKLSPSELEFHRGEMQTGCSGFFQQQRKGWEYNLLLSLKAVQKRISDSQAGGAELFLYTGVLKAAV